jgi:hypothetical protein
MPILQSKYAYLAVLFLFTLVMAGQTQAATVATVGTLDSYLGSCTLENSGPTEELACFTSAGVDGITEDMLVQVSTNSGLAFEQVTDDGVATTYAMIIPESTHFLIKTGNLDGTAFNAFVYENNASLDWAYINLIIGDTGIEIVNIGKVSHITTVVPIPAAAWLFGSALLGLVGVARRRSQLA